MPRQSLCRDRSSLKLEIERVLFDDPRAFTFLYECAVEVAQPAREPDDMMVGRRIAHYEVRSSLGAGGMGEVYRACDTKLGRDVALKLLPPAVAGNPDRLSRFTREARVLASLNHPHIAAIYGIEDAGTSPVLVLELVEGETLSERLLRGAPPLLDTVAMARQVALAAQGQAAP